ncbi:MAG: hypothetical protein K2W97_07165 [Chthoniobacterales bacterium]|nr:hypothetical protein [Chthoniobacterales bacterium]
MTTLLETDRQTKHNKVALTKQWIEELQDEVNGDEPPAWHEAILEKRLKEWVQGNEGSQNWDEAIRELKMELGIKM